MANIKGGARGRSRGNPPSLYGKVYGDLDGRTRALEKRVDGEWVYIGTYPGTNLTPESPPFQNNWENVGDGKLPLRYRWTLSGKVEIEGVITGDVVGKVVFTLPERLWPEEEYKVPFAADDSSPATLCVETDGDVVFCAIASTGGIGGDPLASLSDFGTMLGWWRLGESAPGGNTDNIPNGFLFANSAAPNALADPLRVDENTGGPPGHHYNMRTNGSGSSDFTDAFDDGALLLLVGAPMLQADLNPPNVVWTAGEVFTYAFRFLPGYSNAPIGLALGTSFAMDGAGSINVGEGFTWIPGEGTLQYKHWGNSVDQRVTITYPITNIVNYTPSGWDPNSQTNPYDQWWDDNGFGTEKGAVSGTFTDPGVRLYQHGTDPWWHIGLVCDGHSLFAYLNGTLFATRTILANNGFNITTLLGNTIKVALGEMDSGVSSYWSGGGFGLDELMMWNAALTPGQMGTVYRIGTLAATGVNATNAATVTNNIGSVRTAADTMEIGETLIICDTSSGGFTFTLCSASAMPGVAVVIKKLSGSNTLVVDGQGSQTIDGSLTLSLTTAWSSVTIMSDGTQWLTID